VSRAARLALLVAVGVVAALAGRASAPARTVPVDVGIPKIRPWSVVAAARGRTVAVYRRPGGRRVVMRLRNPNEDGAPRVFLVRANRRHWVRVYLPQRPNGATGWIRKRSVRLLKNPYRMRVDLRTRRLLVWRRRQIFLYQRIGVGRAVTPTPRGRYFVVSLLQPPDARGPYGPYVFTLSAYSPVLFSFGGGPGQVGIHGTNDPRGLGRRVSHGCIRVANPTIRRLARLLPLGTPVTIVS
jgi:lipoprotein-anchoring transpeptidase ErfK/SrfK